MNIRSALRAAVLILIGTTGLSVYVAVKNHELNARSAAIRSALDQTLRANQALSSMMMISVLERNLLRARKYEHVTAELERAVQTVGRSRSDLPFSGDLAALLQRNQQIKAEEARILDLMRSGDWQQARAALLDAEFVRIAAMHEIDIETTAEALTNELARKTERFDQLRLVSMVLQIASLLLLLWVGFAYSRALVAEVRRQTQLQAELSASRQALRELSAHEQAKREDERKHMAQEIHDELGQRLTVLRMDLAMLPRAVQADPAAALPQQINKLKGDIDQIVAIVRDIASRLRPVALEVGLDAAVEGMVQDFQLALGIPCELDNRLPAHRVLDEHRSSVVFRILQESMTNAARHAHATHIKVSLAEAEGQLQLRVQDDGRGFSAVTASTFGLTGMRERAASLGGSVHIASQPGFGTTVEALIPLDDAPAERTPTDTVAPGIRQPAAGAGAAEG